MVNLVLDGQQKRSGINGSGTGTAVLLVNVTIQNCRANFPKCFGWCGGAAVSLQDGAKMEAKHTSFTANSLTAKSALQVSDCCATMAEVAE